MLSVSSPLTISNNEREGDVWTLGTDEFSNGCSIENLFDNIDLGDLFVGIEDGDLLHNLELDPEIFAEFSVEGSDLIASPATSEREEELPQEGEKDSTQRVESATANNSTARKNSVPSEGHRGRKSSKTQAKGTQRKKKVKVYN